MSWINTTEAGLTAQALNLAAGIDANATALGLTVAQAAAFELLANNLTAALQARDAARKAAKSATQTLDQSEREVRRQMMALNKLVQANPTVTDAVKAAAGFPVYARPARGEPQVPTNLTAAVESQANILLKWRRAGNPESATFVVQQKIGSEPWTQLAVTNATRLRFTSAAPGVPVQFRIIAQRAGKQSAPSVAASVWALGDDGFDGVSLAA